MCEAPVVPGEDGRGFDVSGEAFGLRGRVGAGAEGGRRRSRAAP
jgi:hypothetical protein